jgi:hypothetical protein
VTASHAAYRAASISVSSVVRAWSWMYAIAPPMRRLRTGRVDAGTGAEASRRSIVSMSPPPKR